MLTPRLPPTPPVHCTQQLGPNQTIPSCYAAYSNLGVAYFNQGELDQAILSETMAIVILTSDKPDIAANLPAAQQDAAYHDRAGFYLKEKQYAQASADAEAALALFPSDSGAEIILSNASYAEHNFDQIIIFSTQQIALKHDPAEYYLFRS